MHSTHTVSADGLQCDRCLILAREFSSTLPCLYRPSEEPPSSPCGTESMDQPASSHRALGPSSSGISPLGEPVALDLEAIRARLTALDRAFDSHCGDDPPYAEIEATLEDTRALFAEVTRLRSAFPPGPVSTSIRAMETLESVYEAKMMPETSCTCWVGADQNGPLPLSTCVECAVHGDRARRFAAHERSAVQPDRRQSQRRSEANTPRSESGPERRLFQDRRVRSAVPTGAGAE